MLEFRLLNSFNYDGLCLEATSNMSNVAAFCFITHCSLLLNVHSSGTVKYVIAVVFLSSQKNAPVSTRNSDKNIHIVEYVCKRLLQVMFLNS